MTFKVANIIARFNAESGGPPRTVSQIAVAGVGHWRADLYTTDYVESTADKLLVEEFPGNVSVAPLGFGTTWCGLSMMTGLGRRHRTGRLKGADADVVHIHGIWSPYLAGYAIDAIRHDIPVVVTPHGMLEPWSLGVRAARKWVAMSFYQRKILAHASALHATSKMEADNLRRLEIGAVPVFVVPNPVDEPPAHADESLPTVGEKRVLLFLSRLHEKKGLDILLRAWNETRPSQWRLLIVGSGDESYTERLKQFCTSQVIPDVSFHSHADGELRESLFRKASAFILPTYSENFGNVIAEAMIRGLPVVTTTGTPWSEIVEQKCGWYIEPNVSELKRAIGEVTTTDAHTLRQMGARGREFASSRFTLPVVRAAFLNMYRSAISGRA